MKPAFLILAVSASTRAQDILWPKIDAAPPPPNATVPVGAVPSLVHYNFQRAAEDIARLLNPLLRPPQKTTTPQPTRSAARPTASVLEPRAPSVGAGGLEPHATQAPPCAPQPRGAGYRPLPDTAENFLDEAGFSEAAQGAKVPSGFHLAFEDLQASCHAYGYLGFDTAGDYTPPACAEECDAIRGCSAFNLYYERSPAYSPDSILCPNPNSTTVIKCVFWGGPLDADTATNPGQWRSRFRVVMAGSNAYVRQKFAALPGYVGSGIAADAAINAPANCESEDTFITAQLFTDTPFDPKLCAVACEARSQYELARPPAGGPAKTCQFFNTYLLAKNNQVIGQYCALYTQSWDGSYLTNRGQWRGDDLYTIRWSLTYSNASKPALPSGLETDSQNCGACGHVCPQGFHCKDGRCQENGPCHQPNVTFTLRVASGPLQGHHVAASDPQKTAAYAVLTKDAQKAATFSLNRDGPNLLAMVRGGEAAVVFAQQPQLAGNATLLFASKAQLGWAYVTCRLAQERLACRQGERFVFQYRTADGAKSPRLELADKLGEKSTQVTLMPYCM